MRTNFVSTRLFLSSLIYKKAAMYFLSVFSLICIGASLCLAAPGNLDISFGSGGKVVSNTEARAMTLQSDGKIVVAGQASSQFTDMSVTRYNPNGSLDASFGTNGRVIISVGNFSDYARAIAVQQDGKIIVAGYTDTNDSAFYNFAVVRLNSDGSLDSTFDADGKVTTAVNNTRSEAYSIALQPDGKIVVGGNSGSFNSSNFAVVRYNPNGSLDTGFDGDGQAITPVGTAFDSIKSIKIQPDGKIVAAGQVDAGSLSKWGLVRYNSDGSLDTSFDGDGKIIGSFRSSDDFASALELQLDGKIIVAGGSRNTGNSFDFALARFTSAGALDPTFDADGIVITSVRFSSSANSVNIQRNGKIVTAGYSDASAISSTRDFAVVRYNPNGVADSTFGNGGTVTTDVTGNLDSAFSSAIQPDGKIVALGETSNGGYALVRYLGDPIISRRAPFDFDGDGKTDYGVFRPSDATWYLQQSANGFSAISFGVESDKIVPADFDGDGKTDLAVFRQGNWYLQRSSGGFAAVSFGIASDIPVPADYDGDGKAEVAVYRPSNGTWYLLNLANNQFSAVTFGIAEDKPVPADFDGDGKTDLAVFRPTNGTWYSLQSTNGFAAVNFGVSSDILITGDFDGDGKADQAVFRSGVWYLNRSQAGFAAISFGVGTDKPVIGNYDDDGKADLAVWRPSSGVFYTLQTGSGNALSSVQFGVSSDLPIANSYIP